MEELKIKSLFDGLELSVLESRVDKEKANILIVHGMIEHKERYIDFIEYLNTLGYSVYIFDKRGHGKSINDNIPLGYFNDKADISYATKDILSVIEHIKSESNARIHLFAHSMGTIETRNFLKTNSHLVDKVVLCGAPCYQALTPAGILLAKILSIGKGKKKRSKLLSNLSVGSFNKQIENPKTDADWLSVNEENRERYLSDPLCTFSFTNNGYLVLFSLVRGMHKPKEYVSTKDNPIMFIYGKGDPCTGYEKGIEDSITTLQKAGFKDVKKYGFDNMRHEILNETDKELVYEKVKEFYMD